MRRGEDKDGAKKAFIITNPVYCLWISGFNFDWDRAAYASVCQSVRGKHEVYRRFIYCHQRFLCDRAGGGGYLESMDFVLTDGDYLSDSDRRFGVYFDWRICVDNSQA